MMKTFDKGRRDNHMSDMLSPANSAVPDKRTKQPSRLLDQSEVVVRTI